MLTAKKIRKALSARHRALMRSRKQIGKLNKKYEYQSYGNNVFCVGGESNETAESIKRNT